MFTVNNKKTSLIVSLFFFILFSFFSSATGKILKEENKKIILNKDQIKNQESIPRFTDNGNGTVTDNLTGLIWLKNANCNGRKMWADALTHCNRLADGQCGLTDGSQAGDWRLPDIKELVGLIDLTNYGFALPSGHPFSGLHFRYYWSNNTCAVFSNYAWFVSLYSGNVNYAIKYEYLHVLPVRTDN